MPRVKKNLVGIAGPRDHKDPTSREYALQTLESLRRYLDMAVVDRQAVAREMAVMQRYRHWKVLGYRTKKQMMEAEGLEERVRKMKQRAEALEGKTINAAAGPVPSNCDNITIRSTAGGGTSADYLTARLKRDHDEIFQRLAAGGFPSVRQAAIAAGIVKVPSVLEQLRKLWKKASAADRRTFLKEAMDGR
jgi:hypothetical protein